MSELRADTITASDGTSPVTLTKQSAAKAWCNLNGTTFGNRGGLNVASNTDNGTGDYTTTFTSAMNDANYATVDGSIDSVSNQGRSTELSADQFTHTTASYRRQYNLSQAAGDGNFAYDVNNVMQAVFGDLA
jgi:hypothetical protein